MATLIQSSSMDDLHKSLLGRYYKRMTNIKNNMVLFIISILCYENDMDTTHIIKHSYIDTIQPKITLYSTHIFESINTKSLMKTKNK